MNHKRWNSNQKITWIHKNSVHSRFRPSWFALWTWSALKNCWCSKNFRIAIILIACNLNEMWIFLSLLFLTRFCSGHFCNFSLKSIIYFLEWNNFLVKFFSQNGFLKIFSKQKLKILWMLSHSTIREGVTEKLVAPKLGFTLELKSAVQTSLRKFLQ